MYKYGTIKVALHFTKHSFNSIRFLKAADAPTMMPTVQMMQPMQPTINEGMPSMIPAPTQFVQLGQSAQPTYYQVGTNVQPAVQMMQPTVQMVM